MNAMRMYVKVDSMNTERWNQEGVGGGGGAYHWEEHIHHPTVELFTPSTRD